MVEISRMLVVLGATATGKTDLAVRLAHELNGEIISADSRQVYKRLDLGTGKDLDTYAQVNPPIPYHLIDIREPGEKYNAYEFKRDCIRISKQIEGRGKLPVLCGGTGLYLDAILFDYEFFPASPNPKFRNEIQKFTNQELVQQLESLGVSLREEDKHNRHRLIRKLEVARYYENKKNIPPLIIKYLFVIGVKMDRQIIRQRISERLERRLQAGMVDEVQTLLKQGISSAWLISLGLEYKYITLYLQNQISYDKMKNELEKAIHQFAKRQQTWFRRMERKGLQIHWYDPTINKFNELVELVRQKLNSY